MAEPGDGGVQLTVGPLLEGASGTGVKQRPPACHLYWSGAEFPLCRYLAVKSALKVHDAERFFLWTMDEPEDNLYWQLLSRDPRIEVHSATELIPDEVLKQYQLAFERIQAPLVAYHPTARAAQIKDLLMWYALLEYGGIFLDADTLSYREAWDDFVASGKSFGTGFLPTTGVLMVLPGGPVTDWIVTTIERELLRGDLFSRPLGETSQLEAADKVDPQRRFALMIDGALATPTLWGLWTWWAPMILIRYVKANGSDYIFQAPTDWFYKWSENLDAHFDESGAYNLDDVRVLHLYGEGRNEMPNSTDPDTLVTEEFLRTSNSAYAVAVREVLADDPVFAVKAPVASDGAPSGEWKHIALKSGDSVLVANTSHAVEVKAGTALQDDGRVLIGLTAIMKDEEDSIEQCFGSVLDIVDQWVVVDTGSSDGSVDKLKEFFAKNNIPPMPDLDPDAKGYQIWQLPWKGYTKTRQAAMELLMQTCNCPYILKMDLDEEMVNPHWLRQLLGQHHIFSLEPDVAFHATRIIQRLGQVGESLAPQCLGGGKINLLVGECDEPLGHRRFQGHGGRGTRRARQYGTRLDGLVPSFQAPDHNGLLPGRADETVLGPLVVNDLPGDE